VPKLPGLEGAFGFLEIIVVVGRGVVGGQRGERGGGLGGEGELGCDGVLLKALEGQVEPHHGSVASCGVEIGLRLGADELVGVRPLGGGGLGGRTLALLLALRDDVLR